MRAGAPRAPAATPRGASSRRASSKTLDFGARERVTDVHLPHVRDLPQVLPGLFADAAARAREAGFDGVELHFAHAYTMASFLSRTNTRDRRLRRRSRAASRLPLEVLAAVRAASGPTSCVGLRYLGDEVIEGGSRIEDAVCFGMQFARAGVDFLSISKGGKFDDAKQPKVGEAVYPYTGPSGYECMPTVVSDERGPFGRNVQPRRRDPHRRARGRLPDADRDLGRHLDVRAGRRHPRARRSRRRRRRAPVARRSRLVPEDRARPRRRGPPLHLHQLLRGARPEARRGHLQALGPRLRPLRSPARAPGLIRRQEAAGAPDYRAQSVSSRRLDRLLAVGVDEVAPRP